MPKSCKKRKIRKLKLSERNSDTHMVEIHPDGRKTSRSYKQRISDFFKRLTSRSDARESQTCSNNNNPQKHVAQDRGDAEVIAFLDDIHVITDGSSDKTARRETQTENDVFDANHDLNKQRIPDNAAAPMLISSYANGNAFLTSVLIEMLNNEPSFQKVCINRNKSQNGDSPSEAREVSEPHYSDVKYAVGETVFTGKFNLKVLETLGEGSQATIYEVVKDSTRYAAKISKDPSFTKYLLHEYELLSILSHDNIMALHDQIPDGFLMDILPCHLIDHIQQNFDTKTMKLPRRDPITVGLLKAVCYLHSKDIAHLDIKPENILLTADGEPKLADFGLALRVRDEDGQLQILKGIRGSIPFLCPEVLARRPDNIMTAIDAWAVGVVMYTIFTGGRLPFGNISAKDVYQQQTQGGVRVPHRMKAAMMNDASHSNYFCVIFQLLTVQPERRPSIDSALRMVCPIT